MAERKTSIDNPGDWVTVDPGDWQTVAPGGSHAFVGPKLTGEPYPAMSPGVESLVRGMHGGKLPPQPQPLPPSSLNNFFETIGNDIKGIPQAFLHPINTIKSLGPIWSDTPPQEALSTSLGHLASLGITGGVAKVAGKVVPKAANAAKGFVQDEGSRTPPPAPPGPSIGTRVANAAKGGNLKTAVGLIFRPKQTLGKLVMEAMEGPKAPAPAMAGKAPSMPPVGKQSFPNLPPTPAMTGEAPALPAVGARRFGPEVPPERAMAFEAKAPPTPTKTTAPPPERAMAEGSKPPAAGTSNFPKDLPETPGKKYEVPPPPKPARTPAVEKKFQVDNPPKPQPPAPTDVEIMVKQGWDPDLAARAANVGRTTGGTPEAPQTPAAPTAPVGQDLEATPGSTEARHAEIAKFAGQTIADHAQALNNHVAGELRRAGITPEQWLDLPMNKQTEAIIEIGKSAGKDYSPLAVKGRGVGRDAAVKVEDIARELKKLW